ncbi:MAG: multiple sugar transport system substrate-binding protein [Betaproteobacteria bacterium]|jgi:multiple sugar transport system substrate-binding protein|nr:multiple sugar transport system substrate-binding protein [Betaproteobacteria bacterium]
MKRRDLLKAGIAGILLARQAPVFAQANTVHILRWNDFVPAADKVLREVFAPEVQKALGLKLNVETINANDLPARATASIQSGSGPDIILLLNNYPHLYASAGVDVSALAEEVSKAQGGIYEPAVRLNKVGGKWVSMPWSLVPALIAYRKSWFEEVGAKSFPKTWQEYQTVGKKLKAAKRPIGQTLGNTFGDAPTFTYPLLWSFGGQELDAKGKVALNSKGTIDSVKFMTQFWKDACDEGGLAWDDSNNNRSFLSGDISATLNGASIYVAALNGADKFKTEKGAPLHTDILHAPLPGGPNGAHGYHTAHNHMVMKYSKNTKGAIEFLRWAHKQENLEKWMVVQKGYAVGTARGWEKHKMWADNGPVMAPFKVAAAGQSRLMGHGGEPNGKAAEAWNKFIVTVMYAQACSGKMSPEEAVKWAAGELGKIYT